MQFLLNPKVNVAICVAAAVTAWGLTYLGVNVGAYLPRIELPAFPRSEESPAAASSSAQTAQTSQPGRVLSKAELAKYDGAKGSKGLYIALLGQVFDVQKGKKHYGPKGGYHGFAAKDGSRAFVTGDFSAKGLVDDVSGLDAQDYLGLEDWLGFYKKDYTFVGYVEGSFYDSQGKPRPALASFAAKVEEAKAERAKEEKEQERFPPCNSEWSEKKGSRVWCTEKSGGVDRSWVGVPRKLYKAGSAQPRCACVSEADRSHPGLKEYQNCPPDSPSCSFKS